jgi:hypothetical protein
VTTRAPFGLTPRAADAISYGQWQSYPWKNELALQSERVAIHYAEMLSDDFGGEHSPKDILDRAIVLAAFAMRRMFEKKLVTDKLASEKISIRTFQSLRSKEFRQPYIGYSGGQAFRNYSFEKASTKRLKINDVANEIIHSSQMMFVYDEETIPTGLLIASDWHLKDRLLHFTIEGFSAMVKRVLDDCVTCAADRWDWKTGMVYAGRE